VKLVYFAWVRQKVGCAEEAIDLPDGVKTVGDVAAWLKSQGGGYAEAFSDLKRVRAAVNQEHVDLSAPVKASDEIAFFPPVTGG
jgi:sulfur-carrier protein